AVAFSFGTVFSRNSSSNGTQLCLLECIYSGFSLDPYFCHPVLFGIRHRTSRSFSFLFSFLSSIVYVLLFVSYSVNNFSFQAVHILLFHIFVLQFLDVSPSQCRLSIV